MGTREERDKRATGVGNLIIQLKEDMGIDTPVKALEDSTKKDITGKICLSMLKFLMGEFFEKKFF